MIGNSFEANAKWEGKEGFQKRGLPTLGLITTSFSRIAAVAISGTITAGNAFFTTLGIGNNINNFGEGSNLVNMPTKGQVGIDSVGILYDVANIKTNPAAIPSLITNFTQFIQNT